MNAENKSQKVQRWKLYCQEFDFKVEHISGEENVETLPDKINYKTTD